MERLRMSGEGSAQVISLGCRLNIAESERIRALLANDSDTIVVNSCAVTGEAVRQTRQAIRRARRSNPQARLLVTGCAAETERADLSQMPEIDGFVENAAKLDPRAWNVAAVPSSVSLQRTRAFIAIQNGCDHACTFCIIPQGRGPSRSQPITSVCREVGRHLEEGAKEIVLTGVDVTSWGHDLPDTPPLGELVATILMRFPALERLRMSSLDGIEIDPLLHELFASEPRLMPHLHLSLQHGHDLILKRMKRRHSREDALRLVDDLKAKRPDIAIGADLIAGFPTESDEHHAANLSIIRELAIVHGHIFPYSPRHDTPAARMPQVARETVKARASELRAAVSTVRGEWLRSLIGKPLAILVERDRTGHAENFARVAAPTDAEIGAIVEVTPSRIEDTLLI